MMSRATSHSALITSSSYAAVAPTPVVPASVGSPTSHQPIQLSDLQSILATMNVPASAAAQGSAGEWQMMEVSVWYLVVLD